MISMGTHEVVTCETMTLRQTYQCLLVLGLHGLGYLPHDVV